MTQHNHSQRVPGCFRCDLSADETGATMNVPDEAVEAGAFAITKSVQPGSTKAQTWAKRYTAVALEAAYPQLEASIRAQVKAEIEAERDQLLQGYEAALKALWILAGREDGGIRITGQEQVETPDEVLLERTDDVMTGEMVIRQAGGAS